MSRIRLAALTARTRSGVLSSSRTIFATARVAAARGEKDRIERETLAFHRRVRAAYLARARKEPGRFLVLDGTRPVEALAERVAADLDALRAAR